MQVTKGGCVGKTFALAKVNDDTGGKKSKRRSKQERKGMVETFIKRYQASNNGSFPSLHLTHKQVGGSYYMVREIFRELIQENRVLAVPKLPPGEQNMENLDSFLENFPLGSISFDPNIHVLPPKNNQTLLNEYEFRREKFLNSRRISELHRGSLDDNIINGSNITVKNEESVDPRYIESKIPEAVLVETSDATLSSEELEEPKHTELLMEQALEVQKDEIKVEGYEAQIRPLAVDVVVESFPLRPVSSTIFDHDENNISVKEVLGADLKLKTGNGEGFVRDERRKLEEELAQPESKPISFMKTKNLSSHDENIALDVNITDVKSSAEKDKALSIPNGIRSQNVDGNNNNFLQQPTFKETTANQNNSDIQPSDGAQIQTDGTSSNTINLEPLESAAAAEEESKKSHIQETNPIVSFIKTAVAAFMKFWSE